jgi:putative FmdB family regulatory protein
MPLYEYECEACGRRFEKIQKFSDPPIDTCETCGKGPVKKLLSSPAIQFKGSGFYITDYPKKSSSDSGGTKESKDAKDTKESKDTKETASKTESAKTDSTAKSE